MDILLSPSPTAWRKIGTTGKKGRHWDYDNEVYQNTHTTLRSLDKKIQGYRNLLEAGYPSEKILGLVTLTRHNIGDIEKIVDWFMDEMKSTFVFFTIFKAEGFASKWELERQIDWEPSMSACRRAFEYRAKKCGDKNLLRFGSSDASHLYCRGYFGVMYDGGVTPCLVIRDLTVGNIYQESLVDIYHKHKDELLFNFVVEGYCGEECENRDICCGCRATAYHYTGNVRASDPKCWLNPYNRDEYLLAKRAESY